MSSKVQRLYRDILRTSMSLKDKNFREYFVRITRDDFRNVRPKMSESEFITLQEENLQVLQRQAIVQNMYYSDSFSVSR